MRIKRTANAGVLLEIDGVSVLLDGICGEVPPYFATPAYIRKEIYETLPDLVAFTHTHTDHFDSDFSAFFEKNTERRVISPNNKEETQMGDVKILSKDSRHIGRNDVAHVSFVLIGSKCVWFMGDASPVVLKSMVGFPKPDVLFVPFAYLNSKAALEITKSVGAAEIVLLHMPQKQADEYGIWDSVRNTIVNEQNIHIFEIGETLDLF